MNCDATDMAFVCEKSKGELTLSKQRCYKMNSKGLNRSLMYNFWNCKSIGDSELSLDGQRNVLRKENIVTWFSIFYNKIELPYRKATSEFIYAIMCASLFVWGQSVWALYGCSTAVVDPLYRYKRCRLRSVQELVISRGIKAWRTSITVVRILPTTHHFLLSDCLFRFYI